MHGFSASSRVIRPLVVYGSKGTSHSPRENPLSNPEEESKNVLAGAVSFSELIQNFDHLADKRNKVKDIEHHGDEIVHSIYDRLVKTFITPIDREDLSVKFPSSGC